jgi:hypothetical protein
MDGNTLFWIFLIACVVVANLGSMYRARQERFAVVAREKNKPLQPPALRPCSCSHGFGVHEEGRSCQEQVKRAHYTSLGERSGSEWVTCACLRFDGERPVLHEDAEQIVRGWAPPEIKP